jgi:ATP-dependent DNA helicase RecG
MTANATDEVRSRLKMLSSTSDGYEIAKFDLHRRGAGDFLGIRQSGFLNLKFADRMSMEMLSKVDKAIKILEGLI